MKRIRTLLLFVPGWTVSTGSPHLALPVLQGFLGFNGIDVVIRDLNHEFLLSIGVQITKPDASVACESPSLENMNIPYFRAEDQLMALAKEYGGHWNAQIGFSYNGSPHTSSRATFDCLDRQSPFDCFYEQSVFPAIAAESFDVIGFCIASIQQIVPAMQLARQLRSRGYDGFVVFGGNTVSRLIQEFAIPDVFNFVDGLIEFQGERPLLQLCDALKLRTPLNSVSNLTWKNCDGKIVRNPSNVAEVDPGLLPTPDYTGLNVNSYWGENYLNIVAARGCYYGKCNFCAIPYGWGNGGFAGTRSATATHKDMSALAKKHGINRFKFVDEALSPKFMRELSKEILKEGAEFEWEGYVRLENDWYDPKFLNLVALAGFRKGYFGLELVPSKGRNLLTKHDKPRPERLLKSCAAAGIKAHLFCMFGYPGTGRREAEATIEFLIKHKDTIDTVDVFPWAFAKHTTIPGVKPVHDDKNDWALEYDHISEREDTLSASSILSLASGYEELLWQEVPRFLHPTYRLVSPWSR